MSRNPKRKYKDMNERNKKKKRCRPVLKLENAPPVNSIHDLIEIGKSIRFYKNLDTVMLWRITPYLEMLDKMIGMETLKESIFYQIIYYLKGMHIRNKNEEYLHTMILGPPGAGKTTVARILGQIYQAMGILSPYGPFKVAYRDDFVAEYLGQTAIKTRKLLKSCLGGVLFVDEVYSLGPGQKDRDSFAKECMETITAFLSEHKNDFCFIGAGYEEDVYKCFFSGNKGLERRFQWIHKIEEYKVEELTDIMLKMISDMKWQIGVDKKTITEILKKEKDLFKNAGGDIENFLSKCKMVHARRVFSLDTEHMFIFTEKDLQNSIELIKKNKLKNDKDNDDCTHLSMYM
jgi:replication-associated recombination protein RarA